MTEYINAFPGYEYKKLEDGSFHNMYRGVDLGKGGWVYSEPGIYSNVALLDVASMHPASIVALNKLGKYTQRYADLRQARVYIKHGDFEACSKLFDGKLSKYLEDKKEAKALSKALKLPCNAFFGISFATFPNPARDSRDVNNIIALRGALFMKTLFDEIAKRGFKVIHNKTDSCKIPNATLEIIQFVQDFAQKYGYEMEHEATYERMCLIDKAQYVAAYMRPEDCQERYGYIPGDNKDHFEVHDYPWTTTGDEFQRPYIFKTLFSGEPIFFRDLCAKKSVRGAAIYLDDNENCPNVDIFEKELSRRKNNLNKPDKPLKLNPNLADLSNEDLEAEIAKGHNYQFIGRVGRFCPLKPGTGGGRLMVYRNGKYDAVSGSKGYLWQEAELVKAFHKEDCIDRRYYDDLAAKAIAAINQFGEHAYDRFVDLSKPYISEPKPVSHVEDYSVVPCGDGKYNSCMDCPCCKGDICTRGYSLTNYVDELPF